MKRIVRLLAALVVAGGVGVGAFFYYAGGAGGSSLEDWIGKLILRVLDSYVKPKISFAKIDYQAPFTVVIDELKMTAEDEAILSVEKLHLELAAIPKYGDPIQIREIGLTRPQLLFIKPADKPIIGWGDFVETEAVEEPGSVPEGRRISDILVLRHVQITDGQLVYEDQAAGETMTLPGITFDLETPPIADEPGWYQLAGALKREPVFDLDIDARVNIDTNETDIKQLKLLAELKADQYDSFPPPVQRLLREHEVHGRLDVLLTGRMKPDAPQATEAGLTATLTDASVSFGENVFPVDKMKLQADTAEGGAKINMSSQLLGGSVSVTGDIGLAEPYMSLWKWEAGDIQIEETLKATQQKPKYAGVVSTEGRAGIELSAPDTLKGDGELHLVKGRLMNMPLVSELRKLLELGDLKLTMGMSDRADIDFLLQSDRVHIRKLDIASGTVVISGSGDVMYSGTLDLNVQAGAIDRLAEKIPGLGDALKVIGGKLLTFDVTGEVGNPKVTPRPLDIR